MVYLTLNIIVLLHLLILTTILRVPLLVVLCWSNLTPNHCLIEFTIATFLLAEGVATSVHSILIIVIEVERFVLLPGLINLIEVWAIHLVYCWRINRCISEVISVLMLLDRYFSYISFFRTHMLSIIIWMIILRITKHLVDNRMVRVKLRYACIHIYLRYLFECWVSTEIDRIVVIL